MISTHILDTTIGKPAPGVKVKLEYEEGSSWTLLKEEKTNDDGRASFDIPRNAGTYRITFEVESYFKRLNTEHFFLNTPVCFRITDVHRKYHVPLLLNPFGYSTYRGS